MPLVYWVSFSFFQGASSPDMESSYGGGLLDMMKGGAGRLFSNLKDNLKDTLKDTSTKVMQSVARYFETYLSEVLGKQHSPC